MSDVELLNRARTGDAGAFSALVDRHAGAVWNYLYRFMPARADREDLLQDVLVKAWLRLNSYDPGRGEFRTWLLRLAATTSLDELKHRRRERTRIESYAGTVEKVTTPTDGSAASPGCEEIRAALESLSDTERQVVVLSFYHDLSMPRIAALLDIPLGTIKSRMRSALARLRERTPILKAGDL